ncbi:hypothetical protein [Pedobacter agri]|uniref:hypothetical protein n=1 Tax=Pedobacter agri TaxID=454586 RepID=UPI00292DAE7D|nr:hypothetical protein [Pedobacter agri]
MESRATSQEQPKQQAETSISRGHSVIKWGIYLYGIYTLFLLVECIDFLTYLHTPAPGHHPTYNVVHVAFIIIELIVHASITLGLIILLNINNKTSASIVQTVMFITGIRAFMIYYLYWHTAPDIHFVPYIYKESNALGGFIRALMLPAQIIWGITCVWISMSIKKIKPN